MFQMINACYKAIHGAQGSTVQVRLMEFNVTEYEKFIDTVLDYILQFGKLPLM